MPLIKLKHTTTSRLLEKPETGMGYQIIAYKGGALVIFNATIAIPLNELRKISFNEKDYQLLSGDPENVTSIFSQDELDFPDDILIVDLLQGTGLQTDTYGLSFSESVITPPESIISSKLPYSYYRYSPYYIDKRVDSKTGDYLPGTYATTNVDMHFVPSGFAAVGRYALPSPASAKYIFPIVTYNKPNLMGTAAPNYGQAGGGVEVFFKDGATNKPGKGYQISAG